MKCKYCDEETEICVNGFCPCRGDYCPVTEYPEICKHMEATP